MYGHGAPCPYELFMKSYFILSILALSFQFANPCSSENHGGQTPGPNDTVAEVTVLPAHFKDHAQTIEVDGKFDYADILDVRAQTSGTLEKFFVNVGDTVQTNDPLFSLTSQETQEQIELKTVRVKEYQARLALAQSKVENEPNGNQATTTDDVEFLDEEPQDAPIEKNFDNTPKETPQTQRALVLLLQASIDKLNLEIETLEKRKLELSHMSPTAGVVLEKYFAEGGPVQFQDVVVKVAKTEPLSVTFELPEDVANFVSKQSGVTVSPIDSPNTLGQGQVYYISPNLDDTTKQLQIKAHVSNNQFSIKGGQKANVTVSTNKMDRILLLPESAIVTQDNKNFVFIVVGQQARLLELKDIKPQSDGEVAVQANLNIDDRIIEHPPEDLKSGDFVKVIESGAAIEKR